jgi:diguanylate cyclase (GGDEF)-like protein
MDDVTRQAVRLLEEAQTGAAARVLAVAETSLRERTGELVDGPAALHFARVVALYSLGDLHASIAAIDIMLVAADREGSTGWRSSALSLRAIERLQAGKHEVTASDVEAALHDLVAAEAALRDGEPDPVVAGNAYTGIGLGYQQLRLYELAVPQYIAAYEASCRIAEPNGNRAMWLCNLAILHLQWALELYQVGQDIEAEKHTAEAEQFALRAADESAGPDAEIWRLAALAYAACSRADRDDPVGAAVDIARYLGQMVAHGMPAPVLLFCRPFHAVAVSRAGRPAEALKIIGEAVEAAAAAPETEWIVTAALHRTHAVILTGNGSTDARAGLLYGDMLAAALWRERQRTLHAARTMKSFDALRRQHETAARAATTDPLTGLTNRRGFDDLVRTAANRHEVNADSPVAVLIIDMDRFKEINDTLGHTAGDDALRQVTHALSGSIRDGDALARLGGDEFAALLPDTEPGAAHKVAQRMVDRVAALNLNGTTISVGVAGGPARAICETIAFADRAMYEAKRSGGNRVGVDGLSAAPGVHMLCPQLSP